MSIYLQAQRMQHSASNRRMKPVGAIHVEEATGSAVGTIVRTGHIAHECRCLHSLLIEHCMPTLDINGESHVLDVPDEMPLLWALRDVVGLSGTKFGCGISLCGACTVHVDGQPVRACVTPVATVVGKKIVTIEALERDPIGKAVQAAWRELDVVQCGYCQSGQLMAATALLRLNQQPTDADIDAAMAGNLCRCGTYARIRHAIKVASKQVTSV